MSKTKKKNIILKTYQYKIQCNNDTRYQNLFNLDLSPLSFFSILISWHLIRITQYFHIFLIFF